MQVDAVNRFLDELTLWAADQTDVSAVALVGSWARGAAIPESDVDLVLIVADPRCYLDHPQWIERFGVVASQQVEDYGILTSLRVWYADGREVEYGITSERWAAVPLDAGTRRVMTDGMRILFEREQLLSQHHLHITPARPVRTWPDARRSKVEYRTLARDEIPLLTHLDRTETVERIWYMREGQLVLEDERWDVPPWSVEQQQDHIDSLQKAYDQGATAWGAFDGDQLVGISLLGHQPLPTGLDRLQLVGLWVTSTHRGQGVGYALFHRAVQAAREHDARSMYVSAIPSENTIRFYRAQGCRLADPVDAGLLREDPDDIHLELLL